MCSLRVTGATLFPEPELIALTAFTPGSELSLADLQQMAARITAHYRANGYFVAQAFVPAQEIQNNAVTITVAGCPPVIRCRARSTSELRPRHSVAASA